jgi:gliding motility-associated-like protein
VYTCTVTPLGGNATCADTAKCFVTNSANLVVTITGDTILCLGSSTTLTASAIGATSYTWSNAQVSPSITVTPLSGVKYYIVTASDGTCTGKDSIRVTTIGTNAFILGDTLVCLGDAVALTASNGDAYSWIPTGQNTASIVFVADYEATYSVQVFYANAPAACATRTAGVVIKLHPYNTNLDAGPNQTIILGDATTLNATGANGSAGYVWLTTGETTPTISVKPKINTVYTVQSIDSYGCVNKDSVLVKVEIKCGDLFMPTAFSPNDDGSNDIQCVLGNCVTAINWAIYDRWGERVFESNSITDCWNGMYKGAPLNTGVYVYKLTATLTTGAVVTKNGNITLTR